MEYKPTLIVVAGPNGSGKTSITSQILKHEWINDCIYINPDNIAQDELGDWNNPEYVIKAARIATQRREDCIKKKQSFIFETVFSAPDKVDFIIKAIEQGFFVRFFFVGTSHPAINANRITHRVLEGGHDVPITKIISRYIKSISNCTVITEFVDRLYVYDNSEDYKSAKLLFRSSNGKITKKYSKIDDWAIPIFKTLKM